MQEPALEKEQVIIKLLAQFPADNKAAIAAVLQANLQEYICVDLSAASEQSKSSRFAGIAQVPEGEEHPVDKSGRPMLFVAELRLSDFKLNDPTATNMEKCGRFLFYVNADLNLSNPKDRFAYKCFALLDDSNKELTASSCPGASICFDKSFVPDFQTGQRLPHLPRENEALLDLDPALLASLRQILEGSYLEGRKKTLQIFGPIDSELDHLREIAAFASNGVSWSIARSKDSCYSHLKDAASDWQLFMRISSIPALNFELHNKSIYLLIRKDDCNGGHFEKCCCILA